MNLTSLSLSALCLVGLAAFASGCAAPDEDTGRDTSDATASSLTVTKDEEGTRIAFSKGEAHSCAAPFQGNVGTRWTCTTTSSQIDLLFRSETDVGLVNYPKGRRGDHPTFQACKVTKGTLAAPQKLSCSAATVRDKSHGSGLASPFDPSIDGFPLPNAHLVGEKGLFVRGMTPRLDEDFNALADAGVKRVLIFKNPTAQDDTEEELEKLALPKDATGIVPFPWKSMPAFEDSCKMAMAGLRFLAEGAKKKKKTFFHCTVGEDRTGTLAALYLMVTEGKAPADAFQQEACEKGYGAGNPTKPSFVVGELDKGLSPLARKLGWLVANGTIDGSFDDAACAVDPEKDPAFAKDPGFAKDAWQCGTSTRFVP